MALLKKSNYDFLEDRWLKIHITDIYVSFYIGFDGSQLTTTSPRYFDIKMRDVEFRVVSKVFLKLASRQVDPDTLFFQRSLMIESDTKLGQQVQKKMPLASAH